MTDDDERISRLYRQAGRPGPSEALDETIRSAARKAVEEPAGKAPFSDAWPAAASIAAVVIIAIMLAPLLKQEESLQETERAVTEKSRVAGGSDPSTSGAYSPAAPDSEDSTMPIPASEPVEALEQSLPANQQATPVAGMASRAAARTSALKPPSVSADHAAQPGTGSGEMTQSRMEAADSAPFAVLTPEMWEVKINRLIEDNDIEQARVELEKLQQHFPRHSISRSILEKLGP